MSSAEGDNAAELERKHQLILDAYLYPDGDKPVRPGQFADPALLFNKS